MTSPWRLHHGDASISGPSSFGQFAADGCSIWNTQHFSTQWAMTRVLDRQQYGDLKAPDVAGSPEASEQYYPDLFFFIRQNEHSTFTTKAVE
jgi:hypothetical protein